MLLVSSLSEHKDTDLLQSKARFGFASGKLLIWKTRLDEFWEENRSVVARVDSVNSSECITD